MRREQLTLLSLEPEILDWLQRGRGSPNEELIAEIFLYNARNANNDLHYDESIKYCQWASKCNPDDSRPVILLMDNYIAGKKYEDAFQCLNDYISRHPDDKNSFKKTYKLLQRLCKKGDNAEQK